MELFANRAVSVRRRPAGSSRWAGFRQDLAATRQWPSALPCRGAGGISLAFETHDLAPVANITRRTAPAGPLARRPCGSRVRRMPDIRPREPAPCGRGSAAARLCRQRGLRLLPSGRSEALDRLAPQARDGPSRPTSRCSAISPTRLSSISASSRASSAATASSWSRPTGRTASPPNSRSSTRSASIRCSNI